MGKQFGRPHSYYEYDRASVPWITLIPTVNITLTLYQRENVSLERKYLNMTQGFRKGYKCPCGFTQIRIMVYTLGLGFSLWQTAVCLEKYLQFVRSTQVSMKKSTNTYLPAMGTCHKLFSDFVPLLSFNLLCSSCLSILWLWV